MVGKSPSDAQAKVGSLRAPGERPCTAGTVPCGKAFCIDGALAGGAAACSVPARGAAHSLRRRPAAVAAVRAAAATPRRQMHARPPHRAPDSAAHLRPRWGRDGCGARTHAQRQAAAQPPALANRASGAPLAADPAWPSSISRPRRPCHALAPCAACSMDGAPVATNAIGTKGNQARGAADAKGPRPLGSVRRAILPLPPQSRRSLRPAPRRQSRRTLAQCW